MGSASLGVLVRHVRVALCACLSSAMQPIEPRSYALECVGQAERARLQALSQSQQLGGPQGFEVFVIALEAQNLSHLVDPSCVIVDQDLHKAQQKLLHKVL